MRIRSEKIAKKIKKFNRSLNSSELKIHTSCCCCLLPASTAMCMVPSCFVEKAA